MTQKKKRKPRDPYAEYETTIEKVKKGDTFVVLRSTKKGTVRGKKVYLRKAYCQMAKKYPGQHYNDISGCTFFNKGQQVIANPD